jgi:pimeloyl-ACP methyl ester carboxylesterase
VRAAGAALAGASLLGTTVAQSDSASVDLPDQESDGESIVLSASTPVEASLVVLSLTQETTVAGRRLEAGTSFTDRTIELDTPIGESQTLQADIVTPEDVLASDRGVVAVGESLSSARESAEFDPSGGSSGGTGPSGETEIIEPDPDAGFRLPYALYRPETVVEGAPILVEPLNDPRVETETGLREALRDAGGIVSGADDLGVPALVPGLPYLPRPGNDEVSSLELPSVNTPGRLDRIETDDFPAEVLRRVDRQVVGMIRDAKARLSEDGHSVASTVHMQGFSASAQFASRFAFLYPQLVNTLALGGNGAYPLPKATHEGTDLPYPLGTANYESITGRPFDRQRWADITQYIYVGREDQPSPDDETDYYSISGVYEEEAEQVYGQNRVTERLPTTRSAYEAAGANATFRVYDGLGHETSDETREAVRTTHRQSLDAADNRPAPTDLLLEVPGPATPTATPTQATATPTASATARATPTPTQTPTTTDAGTTGAGEQSTAGGSGPGFGVASALSGLGGVAYLLSRRLRSDSDE